MTTIVTIDMGGTGATHTAGAREALSVPSMTDMGNAYTQANAAYTQANTARSDANTTFATINTSFGTINTNATNINSNAVNAYAQANGAYTQANTARSDANTTFATINTSFGTINTNYQAAYAQANTARTTANDAYATANTKLGTSGGSISGDLTISGNLVIQGNSTTINVSNLSVNDSIILLSSNSSGDAEDIGFVGHITRNSTNTHVGLIRKATENRFYLFDNYEVEPSNNVIDITGNNFRVGNIRLGIINANSFVTVAGLDVTGQANDAYGQANTARSDANTTFATVNTTFGTINTSLGTINTNYQAAYSQANVAYGQANTARTTANDAYGQANAAYGQANSAYGAANNTVLKAGDTMTGQLNISSGGLLVTGNVGFGTTAVAQSSFQSSTPVGVFSRDNNAQLRVHRPSAGSGVGAGAVLFAANDGSGNQKDVAVIRSETTATNADGGDLCFWTRPNAGSLTERARIDANGNFGIGTASPSVNLHITQAVASGVGSLPSGTGLLLENTGNNYITLRHSADAGRYSGLVFMDNNIGGYIVHGDGGGTGDKLYLAGYGGVEIQQGAASSVTPGARTTIGNFTSTGLTVTGTITETSSIRIKENINPITDALEKVLSMNGYTYDRIDGTAKQRAGLIAEEINEIIPNVVQKDAEGLPYGIQYTNIIAYLVEAIKELKTEINDLKKGV